ncbi:MAG TPA: YbjN domain-containing protein [Spirochaetales bacterium]|nr:YbjN domain-containing protein [Spirochaetales bacterium]
MKKCAVVIIFFLVFGLSSLSAQASLMLSGSDNQQAVKQLAAWLNDRGTEVTISENGNYLVYEDYDEDLTLSLYPKMSKSGLDRILAYAYFSGLDQSQGQSMLNELANELNNEWNIGTFFIDDEGALGVESQITFVDYIDYIEIENFLRWFDSAVVDAISEDWIEAYLE